MRLGDSGPVPSGAYTSWPVEDAGRGRSMDRAKLVTLAKRLESHLDDLLTADEKLLPGTPAAYGSWDAATAYYSSVQIGHLALIEQHSRVLHALMDMIKKLHRTAQVNDETEAELERRIATIDRRKHQLEEQQR